MSGELRVAAPKDRDCRNALCDIAEIADSP